MSPPNPPLATAAEQPELSSPGRFLDLIADKLAATELVFRRNLENDVPFVEQAGGYLFDGGGKRMRPALLLLSARLLDRDSDEEVTYAAVIELIHTATLIHDDIIDDSSLRRGRKTVNELWGNSLTVLLGDWLYTRALQMALSHGNLAVIRHLCDATLRMTEGELLAQQRLGAIDLSADEYFDIIDRKTAQLFGAAATIPSLMAPADAGARVALERYGKALGTCFQVVDDLLDFTASERELGKPVLGDLSDGKLTLPLILLLPRVEASARLAVERVLEDRGFDRTPSGEILELVAREGTLEEAGEIAAAWADSARQALTGLPANEAREALEFAPDFVLNRRY
jgi:octaprenyl-diphosphate synthase